MKTLRCAIYTRKSSEEGLDQAFNSLHAQREACEAYVLSQAGEGWTALPAIYDDGGFSGGNMERPALKALLKDIEAGKIDVVVVYKVDRLTRALGDFGRIVELFDKAGVSFVSVTQAFNTTTSMGRLTLNVLLSFAQFEREVTGERIRDKIAASKKKGMWMGGVPPLGYDPPTDLTTRALVVNAAEAATVRLIFQRYLDLGSVHQLVAWLDREGMRSKPYTTAKGRQLGGAVFTRGAVFHLLKNRLYRGDIVHKQVSYPGAHQPIVDGELFDAVQAALAGRTVLRDAKASRPGSAPLKGLLYDADGEPLTPTVGTGKSGRSYRYYVRAALLQGTSAGGGDLVHRVNANSLETFVLSRIQRLAPSTSDIGEAVRSGLLTRVELLPENIVLTLKPEQLPRWRQDSAACIAGLQRMLQDDERLWEELGLVRLSVRVRAKWHGGRSTLLSPGGQTVLQRRRRDRSLIKALRNAHARVGEILGGDGDSVRNQYDRNLMRMAFLAPDIQRAILDGRQPPGLAFGRILEMDLPMSWDAQRIALGL